MFELTPDEVSSLRCQNGTLKVCGRKLRPQNIEAINDALDQLRDTKAQPRRRIGYKSEE